MPKPGYDLSLFPTVGNRSKTHLSLTCGNANLIAKDTQINRMVNLAISDNLRTAVLNNLYRLGPETE